MDLPAVHLLLEQGDRSLKDHAGDFFLDLVCITPYPDHSRARLLMVLEGASPNIWSVCW